MKKKNSFVQEVIMKINLCGLNLAHGDHFYIDRPNGSGDNLFIYTRTPFIIEVDGVMKKYPPETTVFFRKGMPQHFSALGQIFANDFVHFDADEEEMKFIDSLGMPSGVPFTDLDSSVFLNLHHYLYLEYFSESERKDELINLFLKTFLIKLSESMAYSISLSSVNISTQTRMKELRNEICTNVEKTYTVAELAKRMNLSESYFLAVYKKMFNRSCLADQIAVRVERACALLRTTDYSISEVAKLCGYENDPHFSRQFKKYTGCTPSEYRLMKSDKTDQRNK